jgi:hypothetical protein
MRNINLHIAQVLFVIAAIVRKSVEARASCASILPRESGARFMRHR